MKFARWIELNPDKVPDLRKQLGVTKQSFHRYVREERIPDKDVMPIIANATAFLVTANDFYGIDPLQAAKATMAAAS